jgi:hypothetical protein
MTRADKIGVGGLIASILGLVVAVLGGFLTPFLASLIGIGLAFVGWMGWVTISLLRALSRSEEPSVKKPMPTAALPYDSYYSAFVDDSVRVEKPYQKAKLPSSFLAWPRFSMLFWVRVTEEFFRSHNNRYLFSYTTDTADSSGYPNAFFLGIVGGSWRFVIKGAVPTDSAQIDFASANNLLGWKLIAVRWNGVKKHLDFCIDAGHVHREARDLPARCWPESDSQHHFHVGGWQDNWPSGVSGLQFYNFRIYKIYLSDGDLETVLDRESTVLLEGNVMPDG